MFVWFGPPPRHSTAGLHLVSAFEPHSTTEFKYINMPPISNPVTILGAASRFLFRLTFFLSTENNIENNNDDDCQLGEARP